MLGLIGEFFHCAVLGRIYILSRTANQVLNFMGQHDKRIDTYIKKSADFAKPILTHLRKLVHVACPDVRETMKWSFPHFEYKGMLCSMAAFKQHCSFGFWKAALMKDAKKFNNESAMGCMGRVSSLKDLPSDAVLRAYIKEAAKLNDEGVKLPPGPRNSGNKELSVPDTLLSALKKEQRAQETFQNFSYSHKKEYVEWITEAKSEATRNKRIATTVEWLSQGKSRNWKYQRC